MDRQLESRWLQLLDRLTPWRSAVSRLGDALVLALALRLAVLAWDTRWAALGVELPGDWLANNMTWLMIWFGLALLGLNLSSVYISTRTTTWLTDLYGIISGLSIASVLTLTIGFLVGERSNSRLFFILVCMLSVAGLVAWRLVARGTVAFLRQHGVGQGRLLIVGGGSSAAQLLQSIERNRGLGYSVVGYVDDERGLARAPWLGRLASLDQMLDRQRVHEVIIAGSTLPHAHIMQLASECRRRGIALKLLPDRYELALTYVGLEQLSGYPLICLTDGRQRATETAKRIMDIAMASLLLMALAPLFGLLALLIRLESPGPIIFRQTRVGRRGRLFTFLKFRSMCVDAEARLATLRRYNEVDGPIFKMRHDPRVTRVGRWLRRTSLDELPQLVNVLKGDMSLVGPRPAVPAEVAQYTDWQRARLEVVPGITGLWQVSGRSQLSFEEMVQLDLEYARRQSVALDLLILLRTIPAVLSRRGAF